MAVHAGHGLTYENVMPVARIRLIEELNIGHSVIARALFVGLERAVREMGDLITAARRGEPSCLAHEKWRMLDLAVATFRELGCDEFL